MLKIQAKGKDINLVVQDTDSEKDLNSTQKEALSQFAGSATFEAFFESDGVRLQDNDTSITRKVVSIHIFLFM